MIHPSFRWLPASCWLDGNLLLTPYLIDKWDFVLSRIFSYGLRISKSDTKYEVLRIWYFIFGNFFFEIFEW